MTSGLDPQKISVDVKFCLGKTTLTVAELSAIESGDILHLPSRAGDEISICVGEHVIATAELIADENNPDQLFLRILAPRENND